MEYKYDGKVHGYPVNGEMWTTIETVWASEGVWFSDGAEVKITDDKGNSRIFIKGKDAREKHAS